jgi:hypothetical protein
MAFYMNVEGKGPRQLEVNDRLHFQVSQLSNSLEYLIATNCCIIHHKGKSINV